MLGTYTSACHVKKMTLTDFFMSKVKVTCSVLSLNHENKIQTGEAGHPLDIHA